MAGAAVLEAGKLMRFAILALVAGCLVPVRFRIQPRELAAMSYPVKWARLAGEREIDRRGAFVFVRGKRESPLVYARSVYLGAEGVCLHTSVPESDFWRAIRVDFVDRRLVNRVMQPRKGVEIRRLGEGSWEVRGFAFALRLWAAQHLKAAEDAQRAFVDLPRMAYAVETERGWTSHESDAMRRLANKPGLLDDKPEVLVGWRWDEIDRIDYVMVWPDSNPPDKEIASAIGENDYHVRRAIERHTGLAPGPCPLASPKPLMIWD